MNWTLNCLAVGGGLSIESRPWSLTLMIVYKTSAWPASVICERLWWVVWMWNEIMWLRERRRVYGVKLLAKRRKWWLSQKTSQNLFSSKSRQNFFKVGWKWNGHDKQTTVKLFNIQNNSNLCFHISNPGRPWKKPLPVSFFSPMI